MAGIRAYGAYLPRFRLGKETKGWDSSVEKSVANFDEDSMTLAVAAGMDCLRGIDRSSIDGLFFATTTPPYLEKQNATTIAAALDLKREVNTADFTNSLRSGSQALRSALDAVKAGSAKEVMVVVADTRMATPKSGMDQAMGDGAAAFLISNEHPVAEVEGSHTVAESMLDVWRPAGETFLRSWEDRFIIEEGYQRVMVDGASGLMTKCKLTPKDFAKAAYYSPDARRHTEMGRRLGFQPAQIQDPLYGKMGNTGAAYSLMLLVGALEEAKPGERILLSTYGDGCDNFVVRVQEGIASAQKKPRGLKKHLDAKRVIPNFDLYSRWRDLGPAAEGARRPPAQAPSVSALWREQDRILRLYGAKCKNCKRIQYPPQRICTFCGTQDSFENVRLSDQSGSIYTYAMDYIAGSVDVPLVLAIINFNAGGRIHCAVTDREIEEMKIGLPVEMSFRKIKTVGGIHNYFWKATPVRVAA